MVRMLALLTALYLSSFISAVSYAVEDSLMLSGGLQSLIALRDNFIIEYKDQVTDGCLPQPDQMKDKMELALRQNGFSMASEDTLFPNQIFIHAMGYSVNSSSCAIYLSARLIFWGTVFVPYSNNLPEGDQTLAPITHEFGSSIMTGPKSDMQSRVEKQIKDFGDDLFLEISRAKDKLKRDFPQILEYHAESMAEQ